MRSRTTQGFRKQYSKLPQEVQQRAQKSFRLWQNDPRHPSLHFKKVHPTDPIYSARVGLNYRVVGRQRNDRMVWFWIGPHDEYERILNRL